MTACSGLTREQAHESLEEVKVASQSQALTSETVEVGTNFTIGDGLAKAGAELRDFVQSQLPCAQVDLEVTDDYATLTIQYGAKEGDCTYRGNTMSGRHIITITKNDSDLVQVDHVWDALSNGRVEVNGSATVDWNFEDPSRHVVHDARWTRLSDGRQGEGSGDRMQRPLSGGLAEGFSVDGERHWEGRRGRWDLAIDHVEMRWADPVPQAGSYTLDTPFDKQVGLSFERQDETTIQVTISGPRRSFDFDVVSLPDGGDTTESLDGDGGA
jgi:hypothetical protein